MFQFTPLREGRRGDFVIINLYTKFQFTPLREGRLLRIHIVIVFNDVSIHAPA